MFFVCLLYFGLNCILEGMWNFSELKVVGFGKFFVMVIVVVRESLWCFCGNKVFIVNYDEEVIKVFILF